MKTKVCVCLGLVCCLIWSSLTPAWGAGTCVGPSSSNANGDIQKSLDVSSIVVTYLCTGDSGDGSFPAGIAIYEPPLGNYVLTLVKTWPKNGGTAPTDDTSMVLLETQLDGTTSDILGGKGTALIDATTTKDTAPYSTKMEAYIYRRQWRPLTVTITGNSVASAQFYIEYQWER